MRLKRWLLLVLLLVVSFYVVVFSLRNNAVVDIDFFFITLSAVSLDAALIAAFVLGGILGVLSSLSMLMATRKKYRKALLQAKKSPS